jgi:hypothetical protein
MYSRTPTHRQERLIAVRVNNFDPIPWISPPITINVPTEPGPRVIGIASGTTARSSMDFLASGTCIFPSTSEIADKKSRAPAPIRNASTLIPNSLKISWPKIKRIALINKTPTVTRMASACFVYVFSSSVIVRNTAITKNGVRIKKNLLKTDTKTGKSIFPPKKRGRGKPCHGRGFKPCFLEENRPNQ